MADNVGYTEGSGKTIAADDIGGVLHQRVKVSVGADGAAADLAAGQAAMANSLPVVIASNQSGVPVTDNNSTLSVDDGSGSLTVDVGTALPAGNNNIGDVDVATVPAPLSTAGNGTAATALRVTVASDSTGVVGLAAGNNNVGDVDVATVPAPLSTAGNGTAATALRVTVASDSTGVVGLAAGNNNIGDVDVASIAAGDNNIGNVDIVSVPAPLSTSGNGTAATALRVTLASDSTGQVALASGSNTVGKLAANSGVDIGDVDVTSGPTGASAFQVQGTVAHDSPAANNPVLNAGYAVNAEPAAVANADVARLITDLVGKLITLPYANPENFVSGKTAAITDTTRTQVVAAAGVGVRLYITHIIVTNSHATVGTYVKIEDGTTEIYGGFAAPAGGGFAITLPVPLRLTANTALNVSCGTTGANVYASASGYKGA